MSAAKPDKNKASKKGKSHDKRKASSPLTTDTAQTSQTGYLVGGAYGDPNVNKRLQLSNTCLFTSPVNTWDPSLAMHQQNMTSPPVNTMPQFPYAYSMPAQQTPQNAAMYQATAMTTAPPWATELIADIKTLKESIPKIDKIQTTVDKINLKVINLEEKMKNMDTRISDTEKSCEFINKETEEQRKDLTEAKKKIKELEKQCGKLGDTVKSYESEKQNLQSKICDLEARSMRENLIFYGLKETVGEDCEAEVKEFITNELHIDATHITLDRVHRLGRDSATKPRPIVAKFHEYVQREEIRQKGYAEKETLKGKGFGVGIQQPKEIRDARKLLYPVMKKAEEEGKHVRMTRDKLYIDNVLYKPTASE